MFVVCESSLPRCKTQEQRREGGDGGRPHRPQVPLGGPCWFQSDKASWAGIPGLRGAVG
jgi:hypothetical protein